MMHGGADCTGLGRHAPTHDLLLLLLLRLLLNELLSGQRVLRFGSNARALILRAAVLRLLKALQLFPARSFRGGKSRCGNCRGFLIV